LGKEPALVEEGERHDCAVSLEPERHICMEGAACTPLAFLLEGTTRIYKMEDWTETHTSRSPPNRVHPAKW